MLAGWLAVANTIEMSRFGHHVQLEESLGSGIDAVPLGHEFGGPGFAPQPPSMVTTRTTQSSSSMTSRIR